MVAQWTIRFAARTRQRWREATPGFKMAVIGAGSIATSTTLAWNTEHDNYHNRLAKEDKTQQASFSFASTSIDPAVWQAWKTTIGKRCSCEGSSSGLSAGVLSRLSNIRKRRNTFKMMEDQAEHETLESRYSVDWSNPIGEGSFGSVYAAKDRKTGERVAVKKISKRATDDVSFQREMEALLHIRKCGGHPHICGLRSNYDQGDFYYLVLDMVSGGEMFDHLCTHGAYSEADAARLIREVASALAFLHGLNCVHGDIKPENLMLSSEKAGSAAVKLVDFGSAQVMTQSDNDESFETEAPKRPSAATPAYSPPEFLVNQDMQHMEPSFDLWSLGIVLYICLTGVHPFDLYGNASDEEIEHEIRSGHRPPTRNSPLTAHLSPHAIKLMERLLEWDPKKRMTAMELLEDPWVRGETARRKKMADSDKRLSAYRTFKTKLEAHLFKSMISWSEEADTKDNDGVAKRTSLVERAFRALDPDDRGYVTARELKKMTADDDDHTEGSDHQLSLSGFSDLLSENMKNIHFPKGHLVYKEGDVGNAMYFINSGSVEVYTHDGSRQVRNSGSFYGEGALLNPLRIRSASVRCLTPVHAIEISREYFEKYIASDQNIKLNLGEKNKDRKRQRAKAMLQLQKNMKPKVIKKGDFVFKKGEEGKCMYVLEDGQIDLQINGHKISSVHKGEMTGEHALIFGKPRNVDAQCVSDVCKLETLKASDFYRLLDSHPTLKEGIREIALRREFMKALCFNLNRPFPTSDAELKSAFDAVDTSKRGALELSQVRTLIQKFDPTYTEQDVRDIINSLALHEANRVTWAEFIHIFGYDNKERTVGLFSNSSD